MSAIEITIEDLPTRTEEPSEYQPLAQQLYDAGPNKVATAQFDDVENANAFVKEVQRAARQLGYSALKRGGIVPVEDAKGKPTGKVKVSVSVRAKITRNKGAKAEGTEGAE